MRSYVLEMILSTPDRVVCEPLGVYSSMKTANENLKKLERIKPPSNTLSYNIMKFTTNDPPSLLKAKELVMEYCGDELLSMYHEGMIEQMVEPDGSFSYVICGKFKSALENAMTRFQEDSQDT